MSKPDDIPQDVWDAAECWFEVALSKEQQTKHRPAVDAISCTIMAERERCAAIADEYVWDEDALEQATDIGRAVHHQSLEIAEAIRKGD